MAVKAIKLLLFLLSWIITSPAHADVPFFDDFKGSALGSAWTVKNPEGTAYSVADSRLKIIPQPGDIYGATNNYKNLFLIANPLGKGDFRATIKVANFSPTAACQFIIIAYDDDDNYVRMANCVTLWEIVTEVAQNPTIYQDSSHPGGLNPFYLRLVKTGNSYAQYHSQDGVNFQKANETVTYGNGAPQYLGLISFGSEATAVVEVDSFVLESAVTIPITSSLLFE
jgi:hypothetical protein